jgi:hypothetical protein
VTPEQTEAAARHLCQARGIDPDAMDGTGYLVVSREPWMMKEGAMANWRVVAPEIERFAQIGEAVYAALQQPKRAPRKRKEKPA